MVHAYWVCGPSACRIGRGCASRIEGCIVRAYILLQSLTFRGALWARHAILYVFLCIIIGSRRGRKVFFRRLPALLALSRVLAAESEFWA